MAFVDGGAGAVGEEGAFAGGVDAEFVEGVACFVHGAKECFGEVVFFEAGGDADVVDGEADHEGVVGFVLAASGEVVAEVFDDVLAEGTLFVGGEVLVEAGGVDGGAIGDGLDERDELLAEFGKECFDAAGGHAEVGGFDEGVGDAFVVADVVGPLAAEFDVAFEVGLDGSEVVGGAGFGPGVVGGGVVGGQFGGEVGGDFAGAVVAASGEADEGDGVGVVGACGFEVFEVVEEFAYVVADEAAVGGFFEGGELSGAGGGTAWGHVGLLVPFE